VLWVTLTGHRRSKPPNVTAKKPAKSDEPVHWLEAVMGRAQIAGQPHHLLYAVVLC
jgi:hypothetical protein